MNSNDTAGSVNVTLTSNATRWPDGMTVGYLGDGAWSFEFAVQGLTEAEADELAERLMMLACGGGKVRHTWLGRRVLGCKRFVAQSWKRLKGDTDD